MNDTYHTNITKNVEALSDASKEVGLAENIQKAIYEYLSVSHQNVGLTVM